MNNIAIIGVGNLGHRHLQSLYELKETQVIYAVEVNEKTIKALKEEMREVVYVADIAQLPEEIEVAIIATNSNVRRGVFEQLFEHSRVKYIIFEKVLFQKEEDYYFVQKKLKEFGIRAWVNCARREWNAYQDFKNELASCREMHFAAIGGDWGLGCNGIHILDLIEFLAGSKVEELNIDKLENGISESKRKGFYEFFGTIVGKAGKCKNFNITCIKDSNLPICLNISTESARYTIEEGNVIHIISEGTEWKLREKEFKQVYQSQMTGRIVKSIMENGTCNLTEYDESMDLHLKYIKTLIEFFNKNGMEGDICPIT